MKSQLQLILKDQVAPRISGTKKVEKVLKFVKERLWFWPNFAEDDRTIAQKLRPPSKVSYCSFLHVGIFCERWLKLRELANRNYKQTRNTNSFQVEFFGNESRAFSPKNKNSSDQFGRHASLPKVEEKVQCSFDKFAHGHTDSNAREGEKKECPQMTEEHIAMS